MKKIHYALVLDESGSMGMLKDTVIACFNEQIQHIRKLQQENSDCDFRVTFCTFNDIVNLHYVTSDPKSLALLNRRNYRPDSSTALFDAIGHTIHAVSAQVEAGTPVFLAIFTDGMENASQEYSGKHIERLLKDVRSGGWEVQFYCSDADALEYEKKLDLDPGLTFRISLNDEGVKYAQQNIVSNINRMVAQNEKKGNKIK